MEDRLVFWGWVIALAVIAYVFVQAWIDDRKEAALIATCVGCGCTDLRACPGGCSWARGPVLFGPELFEGARLGLCSECLVEFGEEWDMDSGKRLMTRWHS